MRPTPAHTMQARNADWKPSVSARSARVLAHMRRLVLAAVVISVLVCVLAPPAGAAAPDAPLTKGDFAGSFGIGHGRSMYLECFGKGSPTVILDAGLRNGASFWSQRSDETPPGPTVLPGVARFTRVCGYDRPGTILTSSPPIEFSRAPRCRCRGPRPVRFPISTPC
jgi:hypothetical protein